MEGIMIRDKRDDFDENEDDDLSGVIHQYNEDNELRRKINEMKKQKESQKKADIAYDPNDSAFVNSANQEHDTRIPDIRVDQEIEKTRVGFQDESDKTLVIMDRKTKVDTSNEQQDMHTESLIHTRQNNAYKEDEEDLRTIVHKKKEHQEDHEESEKTKKLNKTITYVIIGILVLVLLGGIGFGVKTLFFSNGDSEEKITDKENTKKTSTNKKTNTKKKNEEDIKDNSAKITQLKNQLEEYESQLTQIKNNIASAQKTIDSSNAKIAEFKTASNEAASLKSQMDIIGISLEDLQSKLNACKADSTRTDCDALADKVTNYQVLYDQYTIKQKICESYDMTTLSSTVDSTTAKLASLKQQQTDLESKIAKITTELEEYK